MQHLFRTALAALALSFLSHAALAADPILRAKSPIVVPGGPARYDYMVVDTARHRLLAAHTAANTLVVLDLRTRKVLASVPVGKAQGVAVDEADNKIFVGCSADQQVAVVDRNMLTKVAAIPTDGPVDAIAFDPHNGRLYACNDDGTHVWVIDGKTNKVIGAVTIPEAPEYIVYDPVSDRVYQNIKSNDTLQVIDTTGNVVLSSLSTAPAHSPHGLAIDSKTQRLFCAGKNGKLVVIDIRTGKIIAAPSIAQGVDQIAFDASKRLLYCACQRAISVVQETASGASSLADVPAPAGSHTIAVDPASHAVWISYSDTAESYLEEFTFAGGNAR